MTKALDELLAVLDLEPIEVNIFRGVSPDEQRQRVFGGQVAGQALVAAGRTVNEGEGPWRSVHSLHAYFVRPGDSRVPILYEVERIRDGRSFTTRRVAAIQHGKVIFNLSASFHISEPGPEHQDRMPVTPDPETLPSMRDILARDAGHAADWESRRGPSGPFDIRYGASGPARSGVAVTGDDAAHQQVWLRADGRLPDDPLLHACVVAYASDLTLLNTAVRPHGLRWDQDAQGMQASLDHAMWFHRPFRADDWLFYDQHSPTASGSRGLATGTIFTRDGTLVVSVVQEGLIRPGP